jgi:hypothetical protein
MTDTPARFRVFMIDNTAYDFYLTGGLTFDMFITHLVANDFMATNDIFIQRDSIVKVMRIYEGPVQPMGTVIPFPEPKGSA